MNGKAKEGEEMGTPEIIERLYAELDNLLNRDDKKDIAPKAVADFLGMDVDTLRTAAENGTCPFAISTRNWSKGNRCTRIPKLAFYNWMMQGNTKFERTER